MSEYTSQLITLRHLLQIFSMIHMPPKLIASAGCDTTLFFMYQNQIKSNQNILPNSSILFHFFKNFQRKYICPLSP